MTIHDEQKLIERAKTDGQAFGQLFEQTYPTVLNYVYRRTGDITAAEDITSTVFLKALEQIGRFTWRGLPVLAWLYRIASNEIANYFRNPHTKVTSLDMLFEEQGFEPVADIDIEAALIETEVRQERYRLFLHAQKQLRSLPLKYQEVLALRYFEKMSLAEIGQILGKRPGTVKSLLSRGTKKWREAMQPFVAADVYVAGDKKP